MQPHGATRPPTSSDLVVLANGLGARLGREGHGHSTHRSRRRFRVPKTALSAGAASDERHTEDSGVGMRPVDNEVIVLSLMWHGTGRKDVYAVAAGSAYRHLPMLLAFDQIGRCR